MTFIRWGGPSLNADKVFVIYKKTSVQTSKKHRLKHHIIFVKTSAKTLAKLVIFPCMGWVTGGYQINIDSLCFSFI